jgi:hypothetical protein
MKKYEEIIIEVFAWIIVIGLIVIVFKMINNIQ